MKPPNRTRHASARNSGRSARAAASATAALAALAVLLAACSSAVAGRGASPPTSAASGPVAGRESAGERTSPARPTPPSPASSAHARPVHVSLFEGDGQVYGVGFAIIAQFDRAPTNSHAFTHAVTVTVNGSPAGGAWFWQKSGQPGVAVEALYRLRTYWPAHAQIKADLPLRGLSAGPGLAYDDSLTLSIATGAAHVSTVDNVTHQMTVTSDGKVVHRMPVSLGSGDHPTYRGVKVVMAKGEDAPGSSQPRRQGEVRMIGTGYDLLVPWSVRVTNSGEYVHAASWNTGNIGIRNTSHGCTNLDVNDAQWFYRFSLPGDVVQYPNASGPTMPSWDGWGWWNLPWSQWAQGGLLLTH